MSAPMSAPMAISITRKKVNCKKDWCGSYCDHTVSQPLFSKECPPDLIVFVTTVLVCVGNPLGGSSASWKVASYFSRQNQRGRHSKYHSQCREEAHMMVG